MLALFPESLGRVATACVETNHNQVRVGEALETEATVQAERTVLHLRYSMGNWIAAFASPVLGP